MLPPERIFVCTGAAHGDAVLENLPELPKENLLGEPEGRDTANAVGFPAAVLRQARQGRGHRGRHRRPRHRAGRHVPEPRSRPAFDVVAAAAQRAGDVRHRPDARPHGPRLHPPRRAARRSRASTGAAYRVQAFKEKPDKPTADRYVESGRYYWNSGMFVWRCDTVLNELGHAPARDRTRGLTQIADAWGTPQQRRGAQRGLPEAAEDQHRLRRDGAGRRRARARRRSSVVEMPVQWLDVGSWPALAETLHDRRARQRRRLPGRACSLDSDDNIVISDDPEHLVTHDRRQRHDHRPHEGRDAGLPEERGAAGEGAGRRR